MTSATIQEIEGIDDYWGPAFRSVYEGEGHAAFMEQLDARIKQHDKEIEKLCNFYYQGFIDSIRELLQVRSHAELLHSEISKLDQGLQDAVSGLSVRGEELIRARCVEANMAAAIEKMSHCLPLLTTYTKLKSQVEAKRYYPALKTLEQLEYELLPRVSSYKFCSRISSDVPMLRKAIGEASMADLRDFLENIRRLSPEIGDMAQRQTHEMMGRTLATIVKNMKDKPVKRSQDGDDDDDEPHSPVELVDFSPLYRCLHIHTVLGARNDFIQYYRAQRKQQARLVLVPSSSMHESIQGYRSYLAAVLGFFILEDQLLGAGSGLVSKEWLLDLWGMAVGKVTSILRTNTSLVTDATLMLSVKQQIVLFMNTLKCYGFSLGPLPDLLQEMAEHYTEVLMQRWVIVFRDILEEEPFLPIEVQNQEQYDKVLDTFPYDGESLDLVPYPRKFPFSRMVPAVYMQVKEFIYASLRFTAGLGAAAGSGSTQSGASESGGGGRRAGQARRSAALLLERSFAGCLSSLFQRPSMALTQLVQIITDTQYLEGATEYLHEFIANITGADLTPAQMTGGMFQAARDDAEKQICVKLEQKVDEFLDMENYDWQLVESGGQASPLVTELLGWVGGALESLWALSPPLWAAAARAASARAARGLLAGLREAPALAAGALHQLDLDVLQCEHFAAATEAKMSPSLADGELVECFAHLRQLLDLVTSWDWSSYVHDASASSAAEGKYSRVTPGEAAALLERLRDNDRGASVFSVLKKSERDKRKLLDTVLKQLRQLQTQQETSQRE